MCGRFTLGGHDLEELAAELGVPVESLPSIRPRYNIAPTDEHLIVRQKHEDREAVAARWGLVNAWSKDAGRAARQINARAEDLATRPAYRSAFALRRCIVPADGFYEWVGERKARRPLWFHRPGGGLMLFAGLYESWQPQPDVWQRTFTIVTTDANADVTAFHDRMPAILVGDAVDRWLQPGTDQLGELNALLAAAPRGFLEPRWVSPAVNSVRNDSPDLVEPVEPGRLF